LAYIPDPLKQRRRARWQLALLAIGLVILSLVLWKFTALAEIAKPARLVALLEGLRSSSWSAPMVLASFIVGSLVLFPITALFVVSAALLTPLTAICISMLGALGSAMMGYGIGARYFRNTATIAGGWQLARVQDLLQDRGLMAMVMARFVPVAPYMVFNIAAGAVGVRVRHYLGGTAIALSPVITLLTLFEQQVRAVFTRPTPLAFALLFVLIALWISMAFGLRVLLARKKPRV
jgi:phospholipase D1/2